MCLSTSSPSLKKIGIRMASFYMSLLEFTIFLKEAEGIIIEIKKD